VVEDELGVDEDNEEEADEDDEVDTDCLVGKNILPCTLLMPFELTGGLVFPLMFELASRLPELNDEDDREDVDEDEDDDDDLG